MPKRTERTTTAGNLVTFVAESGLLAQRLRQPALVCHGHGLLPAVDLFVAD